MILHLALSHFILASVHFITLQSRGHSYLVKETMTLLFIFLNVHWVPGINLAGTDSPGLHRSWADAKCPFFQDTFLTSPGCTFPSEDADKGQVLAPLAVPFPSISSESPVLCDSLS